MKILVPLDGSTFSETVLGPVLQMANAVNAEVYLIRVGEAEGDSDGTNKTADQALRSVEEYLDEVAGRFSPGRVRVKAISGGDPVEAILAFSREEGVDLIAMSTHGRSGLGRWVYGNTADKVLHSTLTPLLLLRPRSKEATSSDWRAIDSLVVPLDGSAQAESALPYVEELAQKMSLKVNLLRVVPLLSMVYPAGDQHTYDPRLDIDMENAATGYIQQKEADLRQKGFQVESQVKRGNSAGAIIDLAEEKGSSLIVMSTSGRSGIGRWILGSVADRVLRASYNPVLLVRFQE